jgi:DNA helicase-2/ATP-dependent DNA helicase PcrA
MSKESPALKGLNPKQKEAVKTTGGPVLILAGAGSGKTRALTHRVAYLLEKDVAPENILAITFTNKAAGEIKERVKKLIRSQRAPIMGTFHSLCVRILRLDADKIGYGKNFVIYDAEDQMSLVKQIMTEKGFDPKKTAPNAVLGRISWAKNKMISWKRFKAKYGEEDFYNKTVTAVYEDYQQRLQKFNAMDFDDLIMLTVLLLKKNPKTAEKYQKLFKYILVDEYQDTNMSQYELVKILAEKYKNLFVIGDDYQSIYGWRNADIRNILNFEKDYPDAKIIEMAQNYRSTKKIIEAAQHIIKKNEDQRHKKLWTENDDGQAIKIVEVANEREEGDYVIEAIRKAKAKEFKLKDVAVLYRTHAQSRAIEEAFLKANMPYKIIGGVKFYERREVKDILAYLRFISNPEDIISFGRMYNVPPRKIGKVSYNKILAEYQKKKPVMQILEESDYPAFHILHATLKGFATKSEQYPVTKLTKYVLDKIGYKEYLDPTGKSLDGQARWENIQELFTVTRKYDKEKPKEGLAKFLEEVALIQETDNLDKGNDVVTLMTVHSAKGLEFPQIFMIGMEEHLFPHARSIMEPKELAEERRLCYVGITRAMNDLHLTFCRRRTIFGSSEHTLPSRFLMELPGHLVDFQQDNSVDEDDIVYYS